MPEYGVHPLKDETTLGALLWPIVKGMIRPMIENGDDYIIEGTYILPEYAVEMQRVYGEAVRSCFLGYAQMTAQEKQAENDLYRDSSALNDDNRAQELVDLEHFIWFSRYLREECPKLGLRYIEVVDRDRAAGEVIEWLLKRKPGRITSGLPVMVTVRLCNWRTSYEAFSKSDRYSR